MTRILPYFSAFAGPVIPALMLADSTRFWGKVSDFQEYYTASWFFINGRAAQIYDIEVFGAQQIQFFPELKSRIVGFYLTPLVVPFAFPFALIPIEICPYIWFSFLLLCVLASVVVLAKILRLNLRNSLMLWAFVSVAGPVYECLKLAQIGPLLLLSYLGALAFLLRRKDLLSGIFLVPLLAKPHLILPLLAIYLGGRKYKTLMVFSIAAIVLFFISFLTVGVEGWQNYFGLLAGDLMAAKHYTPTFRDQMRLLFPSAGAIINSLSVVLLIVALGFSFFLGKRCFKNAEEFHWHAALVAWPIALLFNPYVQIYDWILVIPSVAVFFARGYSELVDRRLVILLFVSLAAFILPFSVFIHYYYLLKGGPVNPSFWVGLLFLCLGVKSCFAKERD